MKIDHKHQEIINEGQKENENIHKHQEIIKEVQQENAYKKIGHQRNKRNDSKGKKEVGYSIQANNNRRKRRSFNSERKDKERV